MRGMAGQSHARRAVEQQAARALTIALEATQAAPAIDLPGDPASNADAAQALHAAAWPGLPEPIRRAMLALIDAGGEPR